MFKKKVSFLVSGPGIIFSSVVKKIISSKTKAKPCILISDKMDARALGKARDFGMRSYFVNPEEYGDRKSFDIEVLRLLKKSGTDLIVTAGFMRILSPHFVKNYKNQIINIHPSLLPAFPGRNAQQQALDYGVKVTGCTCHFIDEEVDTGPIIMQKSIHILNDDLRSLSIRIIKEECKILFRSIDLFCKGRLKVQGRKVLID